MVCEFTSLRFANSPTVNRSIKFILPFTTINLIPKYKVKYEITIAGKSGQYDKFFSCQAETEEDFRQLIHTSRRSNTRRLIVDNTFATPYLCQPLNSGADFSVHSATKYLGGHGDATGGVVIAKEESDRPALVNVRRLGGGVLSVWEAHQILRGVKTLALRLEKQCSNAKMLAEHFSKIPQIEKVFYPGLGSEENLVNRVLRLPHGGALVSIRLKDDTRQAAFRFMDALKLCLRATSLGDVFTLVSHSATSSHRELSQQERESLGITDGLVRISAGIEDAADIIADIEQALDGAAQMQFSRRI